ncbi:hypothetical protein JZ751_026051, partial [Albula glossodonta]
ALSKMQAGIRRWMQHVVQAWSVIVMHYTSAHRKGLRGHVLHFTACLTISLIFNTFLFLFLHYCPKYDMMVSGIITGVSVVAVTTLLFFSKRARCLLILFLIACGMRQGRNLFITAGTGLVVFWNVQNIYKNLKELTRSMNLVPALGMILVMVVTVLYVREFYHNIKFNNTFITSKFIQYDEKQKAEGKPHVLPLTKKEARRYITIPSPRLTVKEGLAILIFCVPVVIHFLSWVLFITIDALLYWLIVIIRTHLERIEPFKVPLIMKVTEDKSIIGISVSEDYKMEDFSFSVALFEKECLPEASLLLYQSAVPLTIILSCLIVLALLSAKLEQLKLLVSAEFFGDSADERVKYLHAKIIRKRAETKLKDPKNVLNTLRKKDFWFPIFFHQNQDDTVELT